MLPNITTHNFLQNAQNCILWGCSLSITILYHPCLHSVGDCQPFTQILSKHLENTIIVLAYHLQYSQGKQNGDKETKKNMLGKSSVCFSFLCLKVFSWCAAMMTCNVSCLMKRFNQAYWTIKLIFVAWGGWSVIFVLIGLLLQYCPILDTPNHKILFRLDKN